LETSSKNTYQIGSDVLRNLEDEGFNTEFIQPERQPTFDELVEELKTKGKIILISRSNSTYYALKITPEDFYDWLTTLKKYALTSNVIDRRFGIMIDRSSYVNGLGAILCGLNVEVIGMELHSVTPPTKLHLQLTELWNEIQYITKFEVDTLGRLNKTINKVDTLSDNILSQGCELTDHRTRLDQISETIDNNSQDFIKHEKRYETNYIELHNRVSSLETITSTHVRYATREIPNINKILTEHKTIMDVLSSNIDNNTHTEELLIFQYRQLNSIYLQMEDRVTKLETIQQTDIKTMEIYINKLNKRLEQMETREEQKTEEINSKMKQMEDKIQDLNIYNQWVLLIIVSKLVLISYLVYKVVYVL